MPPEVDRLVRQAREAEQAGRYADARQRYEAALRALAGPDHGPFAASLFRWIGSTYRDEGTYEAALDCYEASLAVAEAIEDTYSVVSALNAMAVTFQNRGQLDDAEETYVRARDLAEGMGEIGLVAMVDQNMGAVANTRGDLISALEHYRRSLGGYRELGDDRFIGQVLNNLGMVYTDLERWPEAEAVLNEAAAACDAVADVRARLMVETNRAELFILRGDFGRARDSCDAGFELATRLEHHLALGEFYKHYGIIFRETGKHGLAESHLVHAADIASRYSDPLLEGEVQRELAQLYRAQNRNREALQALNIAHRIFDGLRARLDLADIGQRIQALEDMFLEVVRRWGESIESADRYTAGHCERVADYGCLLAREAGFDEGTLTWFRMGAFLHDVGKTVVPPDVLNKAGRLTPEEWEIMRRHTIAGEELLSSIEFPWDVKPMIRSHHEHWDGGGYPDGLKGPDIPLSARVLTVADCFDALTTDRPYRPRYTVDGALEVMREDAGQIFDPELLDRFAGLIRARMSNGGSVSQPSIGDGSR